MVVEYDWRYSLTRAPVAGAREARQGWARGSAAVPWGAKSAMLRPGEHLMAVRTIEWRNGSVVMIDQRLLPSREVYRVYRDHREVARAIKDMVIRGAPAIGVAAAMGIALGARTLRREPAREFDRLCRTFAATRPTAVNLFW